MAAEYGAGGELDLHRVTVNYMNVWQTIETLAGNDIRKKYTPYEGYHDNHDILKMFKPVPITRRDSFIANTSRKTPEEIAATAFGTSVSGSAKPISSTENRHRITLTSAKRLVVDGEDKKKKRRRKKRDKVIAEDLPKEYGDLIGCSFSLPRITARIERLMGSNVIRLTDRKYMNEVRLRFQEDYETQLRKRIESRAARETERERNLILEGKSDVVPLEQSDHPIFIVNSITNAAIRQRRAKLKTNREKNAERFERQGVKWEREKLRFEEMERQKQERILNFKHKQEDLINQYKHEDAELGLDLLRINNEDWKECELELKDFLEKERAKMKGRSWAVPTPYLSDPQDIENVVRAREKFRETEKRIRQELEEKYKHTPDPSKLKRIVAQAGTKMHEYASSMHSSHVDDTVMDNLSLGDRTEVSDSNISIIDEIEFDTDSRRSARVHEIEGSLDKDVKNGIIMSADEYKSSYYEDPKVARLKTTDSIKELYQLAEEIILGETLQNVEEEEEDVVEEEGDDGDDHDDQNDDDDNDDDQDQVEDEEEKNEDEQIVDE